MQLKSDDYTSYTERYGDYKQRDTDVQRAYQVSRARGDSVAATGWGRMCTAYRSRPRPASPLPHGLARRTAGAAPRPFTHVRACLYHTPGAVHSQRQALLLQLRLLRLPLQGGCVLGCELLCALLALARVRCRQHGWQQGWRGVRAPLP